MKLIFNWLVIQLLLYLYILFMYVFQESNLLYLEPWLAYGFIWKIWIFFCLTKLQELCVCTDYFVYRNCTFIDGYSSNIHEGAHIHIFKFVYKSSCLSYIYALTNYFSYLKLYLSTNTLCILLEFLVEG